MLCWCALLPGPLSLVLLTRPTHLPPATRLTTWRCPHFRIASLSSLLLSCILFLLCQLQHHHHHPPTTPPPSPLPWILTSLADISRRFTCSSSYPPFKRHLPIAAVPHTHTRTQTHTRTVSPFSQLFLQPRERRLSASPFPFLSFSYLCVLHRRVFFYLVRRRPKGDETGIWDTEERRRRIVF